MAAEMEYAFRSAAPAYDHRYLSNPIIEICRKLGVKKMLDLGCGNGAMTKAFFDAGFHIIGCDKSESGIAFARQAYPEIAFHCIGTEDEPDELGTGFDAVVSAEVIEHLFTPRSLPRFAAKLLRPGGNLVLTTPYHGYLKNLVLAVSGKIDRHFTALWDHGHIKFWSRRTLSQLLMEEGFEITGFIGVGRFPYLWKSMIVTARAKS